MYILRAINGSGRGDWSETFNVLINPDLASAPRGFTPPTPNRQASS